MGMLFLTIACWLVTMVFSMAIMAKMTKLSLFNQSLDKGLAFHLPGLWAPESIILLLALPAGLSLAASVLATVRLAGLIPV